MLVIRAHHISLTCRDPLASERYYSKHFGFQRARVTDLAGGNQIVFLRGPGLYLELFRASEQAPIPPPQNDGYPWPSVRNFSFEVVDVEAKLKAMGEYANVAVPLISFDAFTPGWRSAWVKDPDSNLVQITQGFSEQLNPPRQPPLSGK